MNPVRGMISFMRRLLHLPLAVQLWLSVLMSVNMVVPLLFLDRVEARWVLAAAMAGAVLMGALTHRYGFTRILGAGHAPWLLLLPWLVTRLDQVSAGSAFGLWLWSLLVLNGVSLVLDAVDVVRWIRGERGPLVPEIGFGVDTGGGSAGRRGPSDHQRAP